MSISLILLIIAGKLFFSWVAVIGGRFMGFNAINESNDF